MGQGWVSPWSGRTHRGWFPQPCCSVVPQLAEHRAATGQQARSEDVPASFPSRPAPSFTHAEEPRLSSAQRVEAGAPREAMQESEQEPRHQKPKLLRAPGFRPVVNKLRQEAEQETRHGSRCTSKTQASQSARI